jgi:CheY-like chemotaxis protein
MASAQTRVPQLHVLLVEDSEEQREVLCTLLQELGCRVDVAPDGASGTRDAARLKPDVVIMDLSMPRMDGWEALRAIRAGASGRRLHLIVLSALSDARSRQLAFDAGCNEYVVKPGDVRGAVRAHVSKLRDRKLARED